MNKSTMKKQPVPNKAQRRPENKDDLDSRKNEEYGIKGDDVTHNKKEVQSERSKVKNKPSK